MKECDDAFSVTYEDVNGVMGKPSSHLLPVQNEGTNMGGRAAHEPLHNVKVRRTGHIITPRKTCAPFCLILHCGRPPH